MARPTPTDRQREVMEAVAALSVLRGFPPTLREIGKALDITSTNGINDHLRALERKGYVTREPLLSRSLKLTPKGVEYLSPKAETP